MSFVFPPRYEPKERLGQGGGGEVWSVRDRVTGRTLAFKVLAPDAGEGEVLALVREAMALSGLEGLGVPLVVAFGALREGRRYLVRELVEGKSLEDVLAGAMPQATTADAWLVPLVRAADQLTLLHRASLLHGDVKPANIIVGSDGRGTLVDLGLAAPWRDGGATPRGLTPKYAAPELFTGEPLTVRAEVYALGATLAEGLSRRGASLDVGVVASLTKIAARATERDATVRFPSIDELAIAIREAAHLSTSAVRAEAAWPVLGLEGIAEKLMGEVLALSVGDALAIEAPRGSGKTTLAHRLAWTLGVKGRAVAMIEAPRAGLSPFEVVELELEAWRDGRAPGLVLVIDDAHRLDERAIKRIREAAEGGARVVGVGSRERIASLSQGECRAFLVPSLAAHDAEELVQRAVPSLPDAIRAHLVARVEARPGRLRAIVRRLAGKAIVSTEDVDAALESQDRPSLSPPSLPPVSSRRAGNEEALAAVTRALDMGRFDSAREQLDALATLDTLSSPREQVLVALAHARLSLGRGDAVGALALLAEVEPIANVARREWESAKARACLRSGGYAETIRLAEKVHSAHNEDALASDAMAVHGVALAFTGDDAAAQRVLVSALDVARALGDARAEAIALGSTAIAHQRAGRTDAARDAYEGALAAAEKARDAATVATMRLNLAGLAQAQGDIAKALKHLEAAVDMGERAGGLLAVQQARINLANLDLYLGRYARAGASITSLARQRETLSPSHRAELLGLEAEHAIRTGDVVRGSALYDDAASAWQAQGRLLDAAESRLEGLLARARVPEANAALLGQTLEAIGGMLGTSGFGEHGALAGIVRAAIDRLRGDEDSARASLDGAYAEAIKAGRREWAWQALDARARLFAAQGSVALARRDTESALATLEETAAKLPRDLREVFWDDPRRRVLREAHTATLPIALPLSMPRSASTSIFTPRPAEDRLARILEITRELASEHDIARLLTRVTDHAIALLGAERGSVVLTNDKGVLEAHAARDRAGDDHHARFSHSVAEKVILNGEPVVAVSARDDERLAQAVSVHQLMIQSIACVPIRVQGNTLGALYVETRLRPGMRFADELPTLSAFADQAGIAIENARLIGENKARAEELARANIELEAARDKLEELLGRRTEQLAVARRDLKQARAELRSHFGYAGLVGTSAAMRKIYAIIERIKETDVPVLITGESGTGKEVVAKAVHASGPRAKRPFLGVNCGAIPENLLESELFGNVRGAFTGADRDRKGLFREAEGGSILLDEIGEMPQKMQAGLLRVLQEKCVRPIGSAKEEPVDARVIAATNRDLESMVRDGTFREDLFYRLHVVELRVPPLRERIEDIPPLIDHLLGLFAARYRRARKAIARDALRRLSAYDWPGNVRQLEHVLLNAWLMGESDEIVSEDLELPMVSMASSRASVSPAAAAEPRARGARVASHEEFKASERDRILGALAACNWNRVQAAKMIGVPRRTFYRRLKEFGIL